MIATMMLSFVPLVMLYYMQSGRPTTRKLGKHKLKRLQRGAPAILLREGARNACFQDASAFLLASVQVLFCSSTCTPLIRQEPSPEQGAHTAPPSFGADAVSNIPADDDESLQRSACQFRSVSHQALVIGEGSSKKVYFLAKMTCGGGEPVDDSREAASDQESQSETTQSDDDSCCLIRLIEIADDEYSDIDTGAQVAPNFDHQMRSIPDLPTGMRPRLNHPGKPSHAGNAGVSPELWSLTIEQFTEFVENCRSATEVWQRLAENKDRQKVKQNPFDAVIHNTGEMWVILTSESDVYERSWCVFEVDAGLQTYADGAVLVLMSKEYTEFTQLESALSGAAVMIPMFVLMVASEILMFAGYLPPAAFLTMFIITVIAVFPTLAFARLYSLWVDTGAAQCSRPEDKAMITEAVESHGGYKRLNIGILNFRIAAGGGRWAKCCCSSVIRCFNLVATARKWKRPS